MVFVVLPTADECSGDYITSCATRASYATGAAARGSPTADRITSCTPEICVTQRAGPMSPSGEVTPARTSQ